MSTIVARLVAFLLSTALIPPAVAAEKPKDDAPAARFDALDANRDGVVSQYEYDGDVAFALIDADHDRHLSAGELQAFIGPPVEGAPTAADRILVADLDADGRLDENELRRATEMRYGWMDRDGDGNLDQAEFAAGFGVRVR